ncbi:hypothetical protein CGZ95_11820 [Enemella evansiae]|uniref:NUDIX domain-containing protein n=1 Tax=Enemella evansiae TaxID=2016499 RepID=UPI000B97BA81|nr:NUDIX domain-containing protein [Enemella evansiae]OYN98759.1 hypothetical protein CGZ95_11820 [Enemella evansiae]
MPDPVPIAVAALVRDGRVLLAHRHPERRWYPDCWDLVGGHVEPGETPEQAGLTLADPAALPDLMRVLPGWNAPTPSPVE